VGDRRHRVRPQSETDFVVVHLFGDEEGASAALDVDRTMAELPGMGDARSSGVLATTRVVVRTGSRRARRGMWTAVPV